MTQRGWLFAATVVVANLFVSGVFIFIAGVLLFLPEYTETTIPNVTSSHSVFQDQLQLSNPLVVLLDEFTSENYSSFIVASNITESEVSSKIRIAQMINVTSNSYQREKIDLPANPYDIHFYALAGSTFNVTFPLLSGSDGYVLVEFRNYVGSGFNSSVLHSQRIMQSSDSQSVMFTLEMTGFVELHIGNKDMIGTIDFNFSIKEILPDEGEYVCTLNSITTTCQGMGNYDNNYILAETTPESSSISSIVTVSLIGKKKLFPTKINSNITVLASVIVAFSSIIVIISITFIVAVFCCYSFYSKNSVSLYNDDIIKLEQ